ncbi:MAG: glycosyltransferase family 4 protein, partial [Methanophagales archaeon]|nr:glycosyltransferase family 4 protein [Methanophagales archaeon]
MKASKIFVLPSTREGFPNTILEANACGVPAIIVKGEKNAAVDVVEDGKNGFICDLSAKDIANNIVKFLRGESKRRNMCDLSRENAKKYDWNIIVNKMEKVYGELAG